MIHKVHMEILLKVIMHVYCSYICMIMMHVVKLTESRITWKMAPGHAYGGLSGLGLLLWEDPS